MAIELEPASESALRGVIRSLDPADGGSDGSQICQVEMDGEVRHFLVKRFAIKGRQRMQALREIRQCRHLEHPVVAPMVDHFEDAGTLVAVFEHADGVRLDEIMGYLLREGECLADSATWHIARQLFDALAATHELTSEDGRALHMVHGSLGPDRIYVTWDTRLWIHGVGLPSLFDDQGREPAGLAYHAPEQRTGARPVARADVYSAALIVWSLLTGRVPEAGVAPENVVRYCAELPPEVARGLDNALQKSPLRRTLSCRALEHIVTSTVGAADDCPELKWNMDLFRGIIEGQSEGPTGFTTPPTVLTLPPTEDDGGRVALVPGQGQPSAPTDDSTVQRLSDLFEALPAGADSVPAPDGDEEDGWLLEVVRKSTAGPEPTQEGSAEDESKPKEEPGERPVPPRAAPSRPRPSQPAAAESETAAVTVPAAVSGRPPVPSSTPPRAESTPPPLPSSSPPRAESTPPPLASSTPPRAESAPPPLSQPSPPPGPGIPPAASEQPEGPAQAATTTDEAGRLFGSAPGPAPPTATEPEGGPERPWWLVPLLVVAVGVGVVLALITFKPGLFGMGGDEPSVPSGSPSGARPAPSMPQPPPDRSGPEPAPSLATPAPSAPGSAAASSAPSAAPDGTASASAADGDLPPVVDDFGDDGSKLLSFEGYLVVRSVAQVEVVVQGKARGSTNRKLKTHCRQKNVRLRAPSSGSWLTAGEPVRIKCMATTTVVINP